MTQEAVLDSKLKALIGLGASVAAGCQPCTEFHVKAARTEGACERGIAYSVEAALAVRQAATRGMDRWSERCQGARPELGAEFRASKELLGALIGVAAAICVQSVPDLVLQQAEAVRLGATPEQLRATVGVARFVQGKAKEQIDAVLAGVGKESESGACCAPAAGCGCR